MCSVFSFASLHSLVLTNGRPLHRSRTSPVYSLASPVTARSNFSRARRTSRQSARHDGSGPFPTSWTRRGVSSFGVRLWRASPCQVLPRQRHVLQRVGQRRQLRLSGLPGSYRGRGCPRAPFAVRGLWAQWPVNHNRHPASQPGRERDSSPLCPDQPLHCTGPFPYSVPLRRYP